MRKKVIIFVFLVVIILGCIVYLSKAKNEKLEKSNLEIKKENIIETNELAEVEIEIESTADKELVENEIEVQIVEDIKEESIKQEQILEEVKQEKQEQKISSNKTQEKSEILKEEKQEMQEESKTEQTQVAETKQEEQKPKEEPITEEIKEEKQEETKVEIPQEVPEEEQQEEIKEQENVITEEYKINDQMINRIKTIIENNETDDMKTYGYEIVVDSTIPELTNEFTFTEQRVINKITWKCGIIRIYARDYYFNGNHISTQCFII